MRDDQSTARAVAYIARVQLGTVVVDLARRVIAAADPAEEILVGVGHRIAKLGFRIADVSEELIEPDTALARRVAGLPPLPARELDTWLDVDDAGVARLINRAKWTPR